ncbi:Sulfatase [hydrothermal vent metagenome]|uniref:Sulfatase n=1 Tax=hydrothermal vent metagenome TaxID=652676 RepID=A0A3B1CT25_9ZZZZ
MKNNKAKQIIFSVLFLTVFIIGCSNNKDSRNIHKPNVVFVFADEWRAQATGFAGDSNAITPTIDKLAAESIVFSTAVSNTPVCCPYRASLLTGQYPLTHGVFMNDVPLNPKANTMGKIYKNAGYNTAYIGKWHFDGQCRSCYIPPERRQGFDYWKALDCTHDYNNSIYYANDDTLPSKWPGYDAYYQTLDAQNYIEEHAEDKQPFLLFLSWGPPHDPYQTAPEKNRKKYENKNLQLRPNVPLKDKEKAEHDLRGYYAHVNALDDCLDMLLKTIDESGITDNTIFVFTSDHGDMLYSHGMQKKQRPYDESILVPFLLRYPEMLGNKRKTIEAPFSTPDILPTLLGLSKIKIPKSIEGDDFSKYIEGIDKIDDNSALILSISPFGQWLRKNGGVEYRGIRSKQYTYVRKLDGPWLLFDNVADPYQQNNMIDNPEFSELKAKLDKALNQKLLETNDKFLPAEEYIKQWGYVVDKTGTIPYTQ